MNACVCVYCVHCVCVCVCMCGNRCVLNLDRVVQYIIIYVIPESVRTSSVCIYLNCNNLILQTQD